jgi:hypothetical protein
VPAHQRQEPGDWGNRIARQIVAGGAGGTFVVVIFFDDVEVERSGDLVDLDAAVAWSAGSGYVTITRLAGTGDPVVVAKASLTGGTDDHASVTDTHRQTALDRFTADLGPGQISEPGVGTTAAHTRLSAHGLTNNRYALADAPDGSSKASIKALLASIAALGQAADWIELECSWHDVRGDALGSTVAVPQSALKAAACARNDANGRIARAVAADNGVLSTSLRLRNPFSPADHGELDDAGGTVAVVESGQVVLMSDRTCTDVALRPEWEQASVTRYIMSLRARMSRIAKRYRFKGPDAISSFGGDIKAELAGDLLNKELFSESGSPDDAFAVNVGEPVNTTATIAAKQLNAAVRVHPMPSAKSVNITLVNVPLETSL